MKSAVSSSDEAGLLTRPQAGLDEDHVALAAAARGAALCTLVHIEGSFSRRLGAQIAIEADGTTVGSLADGCLEAQIANDLALSGKARTVRYGAGSGKIDFRLPCGGGLEILLDPSPDRKACAAVMDELDRRRPAILHLPENPWLSHRGYIPSARLRILGEEVESDALARLAKASGWHVECVGKSALALGRPSGLKPADRWTAVALMFHDHEWEMPLIEEALASEAFYIGALGGSATAVRRTCVLLARGATEKQIARLRGPIGLLPACRTPGLLALSVLAEIAGEYEALRCQSPPMQQ